MVVLRRRQAACHHFHRDEETQSFTTLFGFRHSGLFHHLAVSRLFSSFGLPGIGEPLAGLAWTGWERDLQREGSASAVEHESKRALAHAVARTL